MTSGAGYGCGPFSAGFFTSSAGGGPPFPFNAQSNGNTTMNEVYMTGTCTGGTGSFQNLAVSGALTCPSQRNNGTMTTSATFQTVYPLVGNQCGFITLRTNLNSMWMGYFDWSGATFPSLTCLAQSGNAFQAGVNTPGTNGGGTQAMTVQLTISGGFNIQVKTPSASTVTWFTLLF